MVDGLFSGELHVGSSPANVVVESHVYMCKCVRASVTDSEWGENRNIFEREKSEKERKIERDI